MFMFTMESRDASIYTDNGLARYGIIEDKRLERQIMEEFHRKYPDYDPNNPESEGYHEGRQLSELKFFRMEWMSPESVREAVQIVQDIFVFSPHSVWLNGSIYRINKYSDLEQ